MRTNSSGRRGTLAAMGLLVSTLLLSCVPTFGQTPVVEPGHAAHWTYAGADGPEHWSELEKDYDVCSLGQEQSPVDIAANRVFKADWLLPLQVKFNQSRVDLVNNGHTIQANYDKGTSFGYEKRTYELKQFHFHTPSEHKVAGSGTDMEMHMVFQSPDKSLAVIGVLLQAGTENPFLAKFWHALPEKEGEVKREIFINAGEALPPNREYFSYDGSLTTPPCAQNVRWFVMKQPVQVSQDQVNRFAAIFGNNARPIQPLNERQIKYFDGSRPQ